MEFDEMRLDQMTFYVDEIPFNDMAFNKMVLDEMTFHETTLFCAIGFFFNGVTDKKSSLILIY